jgi:hypothetical protein
MAMQMQGNVEYAEEIMGRPAHQNNESHALWAV